MSKDYLRLDGDERLVDSQVNEYSVKAKTKKKKQGNTSSAIKYILNEIYSKGNLVDVSENVLQKPKLLDAISFSSVLLLFAFLFSVATYYVRVFFMLELTIFFYSIIIPLSILYFFYKLDVNNRLKFSTLAYSILLGVVVFAIIEILFTKLLSHALHNYYSYVSLRRLIELLTIICVTYIVKRSVHCVSLANNLLIACAVAVGFSFSSALSENFSLLLVNVSGTSAGEAVGAVVNVEEFIKTSVSNVISYFATVSIYRPFVFIALTVIIFRSVIDNDVNVKKKVANMFFTSLFCYVTYVLSSLNTPFEFLTVLYNVIAIVFTVYLFLSAINGCLKSEKYE